MAAPWEHAWLGLWFPTQLTAALPSQPSLLGFCHPHQKILYTQLTSLAGCSCAHKRDAECEGKLNGFKQLMSKEALFVMTGSYPNQSQ